MVRISAKARVRNVRNAVSTFSTVKLGHKRSNLNRQGRKYLADYIRYNRKTSGRKKMGVSSVRLSNRGYEYLPRGK